MLCKIYTIKKSYFCRVEKTHRIMGEKGIYQYDYWRPAVTADIVVFSFDGTRLNVLLIKRGHEPFKDCWAFPGGFLDEGETLEIKFSFCSMIPSSQLHQKNRLIIL